MDRIPIDRAEEITSAVRDHADWIEVGTSLVKRYGMPGVARIVAAAGGVPVLADLKTADDARTELTMAADAGARSVTVLGLAAPATLDVAASVAAERDLELMIDLMELDEAGRARVAAAAPPSRCWRRTSPRMRRPTTPTPQHFSATGRPGVGSPWPAASASDDVPAVARWGDVRLIVGSSVTAAADPAAAAAELRAAITLIQEQS